MQRDPVQLGALRARPAVHRRTRPLFDPARFCRDIEAACARMHERRRRGEPPEGFTNDVRDRDAP
jgi:protein O-GlcNAc transferase